MTVGRLFSIGFIFLCTTVAWFILGGSVVERTGETDARLQQEVAQLWGGRHVQKAPSAWYEVKRTELRPVEQTGPDGRTVVRQVPTEVVDRFPVPVTRSKVDVGVDLDQRRKGLLWYDTYSVALKGAFVVRNPDTSDRKVAVHFDFPSPEAIYDAFRFQVAGQDAPPADDLSAGVTTWVDLPPGGEAPVTLAYRSRGLGDWTWSFGDGVAQVRDFDLQMTTDFEKVDFPAGTISPTTRVPEGRGDRITWRFESLVTGQKVGIDLPSQVNPGPLAARISFFAPVSLLFFITVMVLLGALKGRNLHPMNYFFISSGFFAFHLLLAYLADHLDVHAAFAVASLTSVFLVVSYLRLVAGVRFAVAQAGLAQLVFLVLFSYAFFFEGYTGLTVTIGAVATLFVMMQLTGRVDWAVVFAPRVPPPRSPLALPPEPGPGAAA